MKAQVSLEFMMVIGLGIGLIALYTIYGYDIIYTYKVNNDISLVRSSLEKICKTADFVNSQGKPAKLEINVCFPHGVNNCATTNTTISCFLQGGKEIYYYAPVNMSLNKNLISGCYYLSIKAENGFVNITRS